jgi:hypothetical protein
MTTTTGGRARAARALLMVTLPAALALVTAATAWATDVRGTLRVPPEYGRPAPESGDERGRDHYWDEWNGFVAPRDPVFDPSRELAVVLTGSGAMLPDQPGFSFSQGALRPSTLVERAGATLRIENTDPVRHQLYAEGLEDLAATPVPPGGARTQALASPGSWPLRDQVHPHVRGHLHVLPDLVARAAVQRDGTFLFRNVPAGTYTLKVFHAERELHSAQVTVPETGELAVDPIAITAAPAQ